MADSGLLLKFLVPDTQVLVGFAGDGSQVAGNRLIDLVLEFLDCLIFILEFLLVLSVFLDFELIDGTVSRSEVTDGGCSFTGVFTALKLGDFGLWWLREKRCYLIRIDVIPKVSCDRFALEFGLPNLPVGGTIQDDRGLGFGALWGHGVD